MFLQCIKTLKIPVFQHFLQSISIKENIIIIYYLLLTNHIFIDIFYN